MLPKITDCPVAETHCSNSHPGSSVLQAESEQKIASAATVIDAPAPVCVVLFKTVAEAGCANVRTESAASAAIRAFFFLLDAQSATSLTLATALSLRCDLFMLISFASK